MCEMTIAVQFSLDQEPLDMLCNSFFGIAATARF